MNAKYIIFICFAMNYLVILSVANGDKEKELSRFYPLTLNVYNELRKFFILGSGENLSVHALHVLWSDTGYIIEKYLSPADIATIKEKGISVEHFGKINWEVCKSNVQDYEPCMNQRLSFMQNLNQKMIEANNHVICQTLIQSVFDELVEFLDDPTLKKIGVHELNLLWHDFGVTMRANFTPDELTRMNRDRIDVKKFEEITRKTCKTNYVTFMVQRFLFLHAVNKPLYKAARL
ncbi:uncharacterized protein LOC126843715 [Adelges cooleyi]|uniref:uncharacterized protein LOC126843715 n=1 Tax=Adelges cooleyi TaxID=133065 RepID=UPI00217F690A|nr:uncharacterized protein LOC126843715 [Adelges cooleyi]